MRERAKFRESCVALGHMLVYHVVIVYLSSIISKGTMGYHLWDPVDVFDLTGPAGQFLRYNEQKEEILGSIGPYVWVHTNIAQGTMGYPLCDMVDAVDQAGPTTQCLRRNK